MNQALATETHCGRWHASLALTLKRRRNATRLVACEHEGPLYVQKAFYPEGPDCAHLYLLHPPGGMVSGDSLEMAVNVDAGASALLTTPGAARAYRARPDATVQYQRTHLQVAENASIEWFPLETIVYNGANVEVDTEVELQDTACCALWEVSCMGLPASDEPFTHGRFRQRYRVLREGLPVFVDGIAIDTDNLDAMSGNGALAGQPVSGFFLLGPFAEAATDAEWESLHAAIPESLQRQVSISRVGDFYVGRYLGGSAEHARAQFVRWWHLLRPRLLGRPASPPRIWLT